MSSFGYRWHKRANFSSIMKSSVYCLLRRQVNIKRFYKHFPKDLQRRALQSACPSDMSDAFFRGKMHKLWKTSCVFHMCPNTSRSACCSGNISDAFKAFSPLRKRFAFFPSGKSQSVRKWSLRLVRALSKPTGLRNKGAEAPCFSAEGSSSVKHCEIFVRTRKFR